jgi:protein-S-isoprenylcysteine O-methyltransferase Ste14
VGSRYSEWAARYRVPLGFALGVVYLVFAQPTGLTLVAGAVIALMGLGIRAWAAGCLEKNRSLATNGPYACTRNPLYLGSLFVGAGFALAGNSWLLGIAFVTLFAMVYWPVIRREEAFLRRQFGETYDRYAARVPLLLPRGSGAAPGHAAGGKFCWTRYRENREYEALLGYLAGLCFLILKMKLR